jgi:ABC-type lipoprotein export system ATPase subunit
MERFRLATVSFDDDALKLSTGQRQRLALIRLLLMKPSALLADEPVSALDEESRQIVMQAVNEVNRVSGTTVIYVTHLDWHEADGNHRVVVMDPVTKRLSEKARGTRPASTGRDDGLGIAEGAE